MLKTHPGSFLLLLSTQTAAALCLDSTRPFIRKYTYIIVLTVMGFSRLVRGDGLPRGQVHLPHPGHHPLSHLRVLLNHFWLHILLDAVQLPVVDHLCGKTHA